MINPKALEEIKYCIICKSLNSKCKSARTHKRMFWGAYENYKNKIDKLIKYKQYEEK